jgi:hypothetical protein
VIPPEAPWCVRATPGRRNLVIIPMRPGLFDIVAVQETVGLAREARKALRVVINAAPSATARGENASVADARGALESLGIPVWHGQITHEPALSLALSHGQGAREFGSSSRCRG